MQWFLRALKKYAVFSGRAQRAEYWYFFLFYALIYIVLYLLAWLVSSDGAGAVIMTLTGLFSLGMLIPSLAVTVRRLHDTDRSGWWYLIQCVPFAGSVVMLVFTVQDGTQGENRYGADPKVSAA